MLGRIVLSVLLLSAVPALAFDTAKLGQVGSMSLDDRLQLIAKSPKLKSEIDEALTKLNMKYVEIQCTGMRFPGAWDELGGTRVSPYACQFGDQWLQIRTKVRILDKRGKVFERVDKDAIRRAVKVEETNPAWTWSDKEPRAP